MYPGEGIYDGLLVEQDVTEEALSREKEVIQWITDAQQVLKRTEEPEIGTGDHCFSPFECSFFHYCSEKEPQAEFPVHWLPGRRKKALENYLENNQIIDQRNVPDDLLNMRQKLVKSVTLSGEAYFDVNGASLELKNHSLPACFIDFETIQFAVPVWAGTRPYQQLPFQFNVHQLNSDGSLKSTPFLDLSGEDPSELFAQQLIKACSGNPNAPVFVYNAGFENRIMRELAERFPKYAGELKALIERVVDLLPIARKYYYHPSQHGSWSIKSVLPATCPELRYTDLEGVQDGGMAQKVFLEAIDRKTNASRVEEIREQLLNYCALDTYAMVRLWAFFTQSKINIQDA